MQKEHKQIINKIDKSKRDFVERLVKSSAFAVPLVIGISSLKINTANASSNSCIVLGGQSSSSTSIYVPPICINPSSSTILPASSSGFPISSSSSSSGGFSQQSGASSSVNTIPEPSTLALLGLGIAGVALAKFKKEKNQSDIDSSEK